jgi:hypothetical protein
MKKFTIKIVSNKVISAKFKADTELSIKIYEGTFLGAKKAAFKLLAECNHTHPFTAIEIFLDTKWLATSGKRHGKVNKYDNGSRWYNTVEGSKVMWMEKNKTDDYEMATKWHCR